MKKKISKKTLSNLKNNLYKSVSFGDYKLFQNVCNSLVKYDYDLFEFIKEPLANSTIIYYLLLL